mmetsp:Transcript_32346/g.126765  ORF Transcript_32346/g.126765 Transcript_32346/m.126765 type:complete len:218 (+) Transcript_32346:1350-2003(+)
MLEACLAIILKPVSVLTVTLSLSPGELDVDEVSFAGTMPMMLSCLQSLFKTRSNPLRLEEWLTTSFSDFFIRGRRWRNSLGPIVNDLLSRLPPRFFLFGFRGGVFSRSSNVMSFLPAFWGSLSMRMGFSLRTSSSSTGSAESGSESTNSASGSGSGIGRATGAWSSRFAGSCRCSRLFRRAASNSSACPVLGETSLHFWRILARAGASSKSKPSVSS